MIDIVLGHLIDLAKIFVSALAGAWAAFKYQNYTENRKKIDEQFAAGKKAQFILSRQFDILLIQEKDFLNEHRKNNGRAFVLRPYVGHSTPPKLDISELSYILEDEPNLLIDVMLCEDKLSNVLDILERRNILHMKLQDAFSKTYPGNAIISADIVKSLLGEPQAVILVNLTDALYKFTDEAVLHSQKTQDSFRGYLGQKFRGRKVLHYQIPKTFLI